MLKIYTFVCMYQISLHEKMMLRLKLRNGLQRIHICIFSQNINKNFLIIIFYLLCLYFSTAENINKMKIFNLKIVLKWHIFK